jgi:hypothetical protein
MEMSIKDEMLDDNDFSLREGENVQKEKKKEKMFSCLMCHSEPTKY